jgi:hypothetical protein
MTGLRSPRNSEIQNNNIAPNLHQLAEALNVVGRGHLRGETGRIEWMLDIFLGSAGSGSRRAERLMAVRNPSYPSVSVWSVVELQISKLDFTKDRLTYLAFGRYAFFFSSPNPNRSRRSFCSSTMQDTVQPCPDRNLNLGPGKAHQENKTWTSSLGPQIKFSFFWWQGSAMGLGARESLLSRSTSASPATTVHL